MLKSSHQRKEQLQKKKIGVSLGTYSELATLILSVSMFENWALLCTVVHKMNAPNLKKPRFCQWWKCPDKLRTKLQKGLWLVTVTVVTHLSIICVTYDFPNLLKSWLTKSKCGHTSNESNFCSSAWASHFFYPVSFYAAIILLKVSVDKAPKKKFHCLLGFLSWCSAVLQLPRNQNSWTYHNLTLEFNKITFECQMIFFSDKVYCVGWKTFRS